MTKGELIKVLAARTGLPETKVERAVHFLFDEMTLALQQDDRIEIRGFGSFAVRAYEGYAGRNPRNGKPVDVKPKRAPHFKVGKELREIVDGGRHLLLTGEEDEEEAARPAKS